MKSIVLFTFAVLSAQAAAAADGKSMLDVQVLLDRAYFSPGEIDGAGGGNTRKALAAYQQAHGLPVSGKADAATLAALQADQAPTLDHYTLLDSDVAGPFVAIPADMMGKSKLPSLGYRSALEDLGERFHASPNLLRRLNPGSGFDHAGDVIVVPNVATSPMAKAAKVVVDRSDASVSLLDASDHVMARFPASTGSEHDPLPVGDWKIKGVARNPVFHYNPDLFWDSDNVGKEKATLPAGPNGPVGVVWIELSKPHYGIHGSPEPSKIGKTESHGCIRLTNWSALVVADAVQPGTPAVLQE